MAAFSLFYQSSLIDSLLIWHFLTSVVMKRFVWGKPHILPVTQAPQQDHFSPQINIFLHRWHTKISNNLLFQTYLVGEKVPFKLFHSPWEALSACILQERSENTSNSRNPRNQPAREQTQRSAGCSWWRRGRCRLHLLKSTVQFVLGAGPCTASWTLL